MLCCALSTVARGIIDRMFESVQWLKDHALAEELGADVNGAQGIQATTSETVI